MSQISISEIINLVSNAKTEDEKIALLQQHDTLPLRVLLQTQYNKAIQLYITKNNLPSWRPSVYHESHGLLYREFRMLRYLIKGGIGDNLEQAKREKLALQVLESIDKDDAEYFKNVLLQVPTKGITISIINKAYDNIIPTTVKEGN